MPGDTVRIKRTKYDFMVGPQIKFRGTSRLEPFAKALFGVSKLKNQSRFLSNNTEIDRIEDNFTAFSVSLGGGVDVSLSRRFAVRLFQVEYNPIFPKRRNVILATSFPGDETVFEGKRRDNIKFSIGVIFR